MTTPGDLQHASRVQLLDRLGMVVATVPASDDLDSLRLDLTDEEARACQTVRLLDDQGRVLAEVPARSQSCPV